MAAIHVHGRGDGTAVNVFLKKIIIIFVSLTKHCRLSEYSAFCYVPQLVIAVRLYAPVIKRRQRDASVGHWFGMVIFTFNSLIKVDKSSHTKITALRELSESNAQQIIVNFKVNHEGASPA